MSRALLEIIYLGLCFIAIAIASILIYNGVYGTVIIYILGFTFLALLIYIIFKILKKWKKLKAD